MYLYINGLLDASKKNGHDIPSTGYMTVGGNAYNHYSPDRCFRGRMAQVFGAEGKVTTADVSNLFTGSVLPTGVGKNCRGWWKFNEAEGTVVYDSSGFGSDMVLTTGDHW